MDERKELIAYLYKIIGGEGCCMGACSGNEIYKDDGGWNLFLEGFMNHGGSDAPWMTPKNPSGNTRKWALDYPNVILDLPANAIVNLLLMVG